MVFITEGDANSLILPSRHVDDEDKGVNELSTPRWEAVLGIHQRELLALSFILPGRHVDDDDKGRPDSGPPCRNSEKIS